VTILYDIRLAKDPFHEELVCCRGLRQRLLLRLLLTLRLLLPLVKRRSLHRFLGLRHLLLLGMHHHVAVRLLLLHHVRLLLQHELLLRPIGASGGCSAGFNTQHGHAGRAHIRQHPHAVHAHRLLLHLIQRATRQERGGKGKDVKR
jgi:hypothetical protein